MESAQYPMYQPDRPRSVIDYTMQARAMLHAYKQNLISAVRACDIDTYVSRAAKYHGIETEKQCKICDDEMLVELNYVIGKELGPFSGRIKTPDELREMAFQHGEFRVYILEICKACGWNHLVRSYVLGDGIMRRPLRKPRDWIG